MILTTMVLGNVLGNGNDSGNKPRHPSSEGTIDQVWTKIKRIVEMVYDKIFGAIAEFFDDQRSNTWKLFGKTNYTVMPLSRNPIDRCRVAIYINIGNNS
ncbi:unnamed protein product [Onchocerca flexuosa]|uniref:DDE_Tnp_1_7 domain-containing protein n=1 Tax=Onchocerca flexuosa TaxID=387005 RepID=A0A183I5R9_9BILA|nr:unnamed protein product [Onchocerca flexuosa]